MTSPVSGSSPVAPPSVSGTGMGGKMGKDEFIKLFVTQLRHQDPMNPMNPDQMASQLAQFSSVEQLMNINAQLEAQARSTEQVAAALAGSTALGALGRTVTAVGNGVVIPESGEATVSAVVGTGGGSATLKVYDAAGREVGSRELGAVRGGWQTFELGSAADGLPPGKYTYAIEVVDAAGSPVPVQSYTTGRVEGIRHGPSGPMLIVDGLEIPLVSVIEVMTK